MVSENSSIVLRNLASQNMAGEMYLTRETIDHGKLSILDSLYLRIVFSRLIVLPDIESYVDFMISVM